MGAGGGEAYFYPFPPYSPLLKAARIYTQTRTCTRTHTRTPTGPWLLLPQGPPLFDLLDSLDAATRDPYAPFRMPIMDRYRCAVNAVGAVHAVGAVYAVHAVHATVVPRECLPPPCLFVAHEEGEGRMPTLRQPTRP
jgi:hypothetical protein